MFDKMFDLTNEYFVNTMIMFVFNLVFQFLLIRLVYYRYSKKETYMFSFFLIAIIVFLVGSVLNAVQIQAELAVGLLAIFTILRLRTRSITMKDMSYLFAVIGISVINAMRFMAFPLLGRVIINLIIIISTLILEEYLARNKFKSFSIIYENLDLLKPERKNDLLADLSSLTGKKIVKVKVDEVDYKKKSAGLVIYYHDRNPD